MTAKKKAFTLVELLAVIIVLGIILVITIPKVLNLVDVSKEGTFKSNVNEALNITKMHFNEKFMMKLNPNATYNFNNGNIEVNGESLSITKGEMNLIGYISINEDGESKISLSNDKYCAVKKYSDDEMQVYKAGSADCVVSDRTMLTVVLNGGELRSPFAESYQPNEIVPLTRPTKKSAVFAGWAVTRGNSRIQSGNLIMGNEDTTITAMWGNRFKLTVILNGGTLDQQFEEEYAVDTELELRTPIKDGNVFTNWRVTEGNSTINGNTFIMGSEDTVIEAVFTTCEAGTYALAGATSCTSCDAGTYSEAGSTSCINCEAGTYAAVGSGSCIKCPAGQYSGAKAGSCTNCTTGSYSAVGASSCTACTDGTTTSGNGQSSCNANCSNNANASTWNDVTWGSTNSMSGLCSIKSCATNYTLTGNACKDTEKPTCTLKVTTSGVQFNTKTDNVGVSAFGLAKSSTATYNSTTTLALSAATYYGFVKDAAGNTNSCSKTVKATTANVNCPNGYTVCGDSNTSCKYPNCYARYVAYKNGQLSDLCKGSSNISGTYCYYFSGNNGITYSCSSGYTKLNNSWCYK